MIVNNLINRRVLTKLFVLWVVVTFGASIIAVNVQNSEIATADTTNVSKANAENMAKTKDKLITGELIQMVTLPERLVIDSLNIDLNVVNPNTTDVNELDKELLKSVVRYPTSGMLGETNKNIVIFGHSARIPTFRGMYRAFNDIEYLNEGEVITLVGGGREYSYRVSRVYKSSAETGEIVLGTNNNKLTLVTCDGFGKKTDRWIVEADFIGVYMF